MFKLQKLDLLSNVSSLWSTIITTEITTLFFNFFLELYSTTIRNGIYIFRIYETTKNTEVKLKFEVWLVLSLKFKFTG